MKPKRTGSSYLLIIGLLSLTVVIIWLAYQIYAGLTKSQISERQKEAIIPLVGAIQTNVLDNLSGRRKFSPEDFAQVVFNISVSSPSSQPGASF